MTRAYGEEQRGESDEEHNQPTADAQECSERQPGEDTSQQGQTGTASDRQYTNREGG